MADNLTAVVYGPKDFRMEMWERPEPGEKEVQISVQNCGLCATDIEVYRHAEIKGLDIEMPWILGHEASGIITKLGKGVTSLKVGDRVATESLRICRHCDLCKSGHYNMCNVKNFGKCFTRYMVLPADFCHKLPDNVDFESAALAEPLCVAVRICTRSGIKLGDHVLILGSDLRPERLEHAKRLGADNTFLVKNQSIPELVDELVKLIGKKPDVVIECVGIKATVELGMKITKPTGCFLVAGVGTTSIEVPLFETVLNEIDIRGTAAYANHYPQALSLLSTGRVNMKSMITHRFPLEKVE
ncbi:hypothetical protein KUTeg_017630 [Tegillarca granosa]|uniref:Sorbitol dehydrogenase n=1 Tax=Tegillarca granosa TaxID=220873 RepID=A0ABQ9EKC7_TEGGR|nr:hypothetical protein KUTeg_017630 [Tegillarca granosa]